MNRRAFTLVELLVVIAIIGLLSTVAVISTNSSRDKARIAAGLDFDSRLYQALGSEVVGSWVLNEGSGTVANDSSGMGNAGAIIGATWSTDTPQEKGYSLRFDGSDDYVNLGNFSGAEISRQFTFPLG